jgi:hypothetical protein
MLEFFAGKMMPFRNDQSLFLCAARSGRSEVLQSFTVYIWKIRLTERFISVEDSVFYLL